MSSAAPSLHWPDLLQQLLAQQSLTQAQAADLMAGRWYLNIHTAANPGGEIRGQVVPAK